jgi:hypothetical protein
MCLKIAVAAPFLAFDEFKSLRVSDETSRDRLNRQNPEKYNYFPVTSKP